MPRLAPEAESEHHPRLTVVADLKLAAAAFEFRRSELQPAFVFLRRPCSAYHGAAAPRLLSTCDPALRFDGGVLPTVLGNYCCALALRYDSFVISFLFCSLLLHCVAVMNLHASSVTSCF